jgi:hypothetical protein
MMQCHDLDDLIEAIAARDIEPDAAARAHLDRCARCSAALALAREIEGALAAPPPAAPAQFANTVMARVRRERWRREQRLDVVFNVSIAAGILLVVGGVWMLLNLSGLTAVTGEASRVLAEASADVFARAASAAPTYALATLMFVMAVGIWAWAERRLI